MINILDGRGTESIIYMSDHIKLFHTIAIKDINYYTLSEIFVSRFVTK